MTDDGSVIILIHALLEYSYQANDLQRCKSVKDIPQYFPRDFLDGFHVGENIILQCRP